MADILDEVLNDQKDEKRLVLFRKLFPIIIGATVVIAIAMAGYNWYQNKVISHNREIGDMLVELASGEYGDDKATIEAMEQLIESGENRQVELVQIKIVNRLIHGNNTIDAMKKLESIIEQKNYYEITTAYARLLWVSLVLDQKDLSEEMQMKARNYLQYFKDENQVFFANATLLKSFFYQKNKQNDLAAEHANSLINSPRVPIAIREQAKALVAHLNLSQG